MFFSSLKSFLPLRSILVNYQRFKVTSCKSDEVCILLTTVADKRMGESLAKKLLDKKLIACCNLTDVDCSIYSWKEKICDEKEKLLILKTFKIKIPDIEVVLNQDHPYECPEIIAINVDYVGEKYLNWMKQQID
jgi:periplasmic divalent cation tolerance protein